MDEGCTVPNSANSWSDTANLLTVQQSTSYNLVQVVAPDSRRKSEAEPNDQEGVGCAD